MRKTVPFAKLFVAALALLVGIVAARNYPPTARGQAGPESLTLKFLGYNIAAPGATTNIITKSPTGATITGLTPRNATAALRVTVCLATTSIFDCNVTDGTTAFTWHLNGGTSLTGGCIYSFEIPASGLAATQTQTTSPKALVWNFQVETNGVIQELEVDEVDTGI